MSKHQRKSTRERRERFTAPRATTRFSWNRAVLGLALILAGTVVYVVLSKPGISKAAETEGPVLTGDVHLDAAQFDDGQAHFYRYQTESGKELRFFVLKSTDGVIRAAFDTCDVCYRERKGYRQVGDTMVCNNCGKAFRSTDINVLQGGCNPVPLERVIQNGQVALTASALQAGAFYF